MISGPAVVEVETGERYKLFQLLASILPQHRAFINGLYESRNTTDIAYLDNKTIIAGCTGGIDNETTAYLAAMGVSPLLQYRRKGIGRETLNFFEEEMKSKKITTIRLDTDPEHVGWFERAGYREIWRGMQQRGGGSFNGEMYPIKI